MSDEAMDFEFEDFDHGVVHHSQGDSTAHDSGGMGALEFGMGYAFAGHLLDRQREQLVDELGPNEDPNTIIDIPSNGEGPDAREAKPKLVNAAEGTPTPAWEMFVGQEPLKRQLRIHIDSAKKRGKALDHVLLASGMPGVGKTMMARIIAEEMDSEIIMLVPPFHVSTLREGAIKLPDQGVLFIDEIHKLADHGKSAAENLLHILQERRIYADGAIIKLNDITVVGATTDADKLPETVIDRFPIKPYYQPYTERELRFIVANFEGELGVVMPDDLAWTIAEICRGIPRVARELVIAVRDLYVSSGQFPSERELMEFKELTADGLTRAHRDYLKNLYHFFGRAFNDGRYEYIAGENSMMNMLRETKQGIQRIERYLMELGYIDRSPMGRRLTDRGLSRTLNLIEEEEEAA